MKHAVCAFIVDANNRVLSVSRKDNHNDKGLPGGKVEDDETHLEALQREVFEETGLTVVEYRRIFTKKQSNHEVVTFLCKTTGEISTTEKGLVEYISIDRLLSKDNTFWEYNTAMIRSILTQHFEQSIENKYNGDLVTTNKIIL